MGCVDDRGWAASLAMAFDEKRVREFYAEKRPITSFIANLGGRMDPIDSIPVAGPMVRAAAVARMGKVVGTAAHSGTRCRREHGSLAVATQGTRAKLRRWSVAGYGFADCDRCIDWLCLRHQCGRTGGPQGTIQPAGHRSQESTLKATQEARIALNEGIDALVHAEDVRLDRTLRTDPQNCRKDCARNDLGWKMRTNRSDETCNHR